MPLYPNQPRVPRIPKPVTSPPVDASCCTSFGTADGSLEVVVFPSTVGALIGDGLGLGEGVGAGVGVGVGVGLGVTITGFGVGVGVETTVEFPPDVPPHITILA